MPVIREQRQYQVGPIGVARASQTGAMVGNAIAENADRLANMFFRAEAQQAEKKGIEQARAADLKSVITINPETGEPEAYKPPESFGTIAADAYQRVIMRRFEQSIDDEIKLKSKELAAKYRDQPAIYEQTMADYIASMGNAAEGQFKSYINDVGTSYLQATRLNLNIAKMNAERRAAAAAQKAAVFEANQALRSMAATNGPGNWIKPLNTLYPISQITGE